MAKIVFHLLLVFGFINFAAASFCPASVDGELYWKSVLPNTQMPKNLQALLQPAGTNYAVNILDNLALMTTKDEDSKDKTTFSLLYTSARYRTLAYFLKTDIHPGKEMNIPQLQATTTTQESSATFLPCKVTTSIPFSSNKFSETLKQFSLQPESTEAKTMKQTIQDCEAEGIQGEDKFCATSLESLLDSIVSRMGNKVQILSNEAEKETKTADFTLGEGVKNMGEKNIVCHKTKYPYAVFYCHSLWKTDVYDVPLVGSDGTKATAVVACHKDTSGWNPSLSIFKQLNVEPGSAAICHFLSKDTIVWIPK